MKKERKRKEQKIIDSQVDIITGILIENVGGNRKQYVDIKKIIITTATKVSMVATIQQCFY